jgi:peptidyl-prolyl cis-trans isomerase B (cyclophilin B)
MITMHTTRRIPFTALAAALLLVGAGCTAGQVAVPPEAANADTALSMKASDIVLPSAPPIAEPEPSETDDSSTETVTDDTTMDYQVPKAFPGILPDAELKGKQIRIATTKGEIVFEVLADEAPKAASNMIALARAGYYDGITFHRVVPDFVIQGGDPTGTGTGGPGYRFEDEPVSLDYERGIVAMANAGPDTNGSQFFIVLKDQPSLPKLYTVFGRVTSGIEVVDAIRVGDTMTKVTVEDKQAVRRETLPRMPGERFALRGAS